MRFNIEKTNDVLITDRVKEVMSDFDIKAEHSNETFCGSFDFEGKEWNIGVIVGGSGTGKSTIARQVFSDSYIRGYEYDDKSVLDNMPTGCSVKEIERAFTSVGFSSPPSWLKPYSVLSTGEKMRVDLARSILLDRDLIVFDEFTSVVDREVAKTCSLAMQKEMRRKGKRFIAVSCHKDIIEYICPDWIYDTDQNCFFWTVGQYVTPRHKIDVYQTNGLDKQEIWKLFRKYHYLNTDLAKPAQQYVGIMDGKLVCHTGVIQAPLRKGFKQVHRLVVLPDYQGVGIGTKFITFIAKLYADQNLTMKLITTTPAIRFALDKSDNWDLRRSGKVQPNGNKKYLAHISNSESSNRITYTYFYTEGRSCCKCGKCMREGFIIHDTDYYCSDECLAKDYTDEEYNAIYDNDEGYWTEWEE